MGWPVQQPILWIGYARFGAYPAKPTSTTSRSLKPVGLTLELWFACRVHIGWRYDIRRAGWVPDPGRIGVLNTEPIGDPIADAAPGMLWPDLAHDRGLSVAAMR